MKKPKFRSRPEDVVQERIIRDGKLGENHDPETSLRIATMTTEDVNRRAWDRLATEAPDAPLAADGRRRLVAPGDGWRARTRR